MPKIGTGLVKFEALMVLHRTCGPVQATLDCCRRLAGQVHLADEQKLAEQAACALPVEAVVIDQTVGHERAMEIIPLVRGLCGNAPIIMVSENPTLDWAVKLVRAGAHDYLSAPLEEHSLRTIIAQAGSLRGEPAPPEAATGDYFCECCPKGVPIAGKSEAIRKTLATIRMVASSACNPVLILGETGTGKELAARAVHAWRCSDPEKFIAVNCAALTANLLESELFGHVKGAFTGADREKTGLMELAGSGSVFLDEISEMAGELQAKLLRVLQERSFRKVGGTRDIRSEATIIASSNRDLLAEVKAGRFRKDLYYRLAIFPIRMPALREPPRRSDILLLSEYFIRNSNIPARGGVVGISRPAQMELMAHTWPGNVRELRNVIDRALILETTREITPFSLLIDPDVEADPAAAAASPALPAASPGPPAAGPTAAPPQQDAYGPPPAVPDFSLEAAEREFILRALKETNWQRTRAAALLGITRATLLAKLKRYDLKVPASGFGAREQETPIRDEGIGTRE